MNAILLVLSAAVLIGCVMEAPAQTARPAAARADGEFEALARSLGPANVGIAVKPLGGGAIVGVNLDRAMPMQSVFKAALGAAVLARVDAGSLDLSQQIELAEGDLAPPFSPRTPGRRSAATVWRRSSRRRLDIATIRRPTCFSV